MTVSDQLLSWRQDSDGECSDGSEVPGLVTWCWRGHVMRGRSAAGSGQRPERARGQDEVLAVMPKPPETTQGEGAPGGPSLGLGRKRVLGKRRTREVTWEEGGSRGLGRAHGVSNQALLSTVLLH